MKPLNAYHRSVCDWLSALGVQYVEEYPLGPYSLDIFIADMQLDVELDGPWHSPRKDAVRDEYTRGRGISVVRIKVGTRKEDCLEAILNDRESSDPQAEDGEGEPCDELRKA